MAKANLLNPTQREILSELTEEFRKTQRALRNLQTEKRQIQVRRIRTEKALGKLEKQIAYFTEVCHPFHVKVATRNAAKLPPPGA